MRVSRSVFIKSIAVLIAIAMLDVALCSSVMWENIPGINVLGAEKLAYNSSPDKSKSRKNVFGPSFRQSTQFASPELKDDFDWEVESVKNFGNVPSSGADKQFFY